MRSPFRDPMDERCECGHPRRAHAHDLPWERSGGSHCRRNECPCQAFAPVVRTAKGTAIRRFRKTGVGKLVASRLYVHVSCISDAFLKASGFGVGRWNKAMSCHRDHWEAWAANCVMLDLKTGEVRFDQAPLFDQEREPHVGKWIKVLPGGGTKVGHSNAIWHHKWTFVNPSYRGFDVQESMGWSRMYLARLRQPPKGYLKPWLEQLREVGLE